MRRKDREINKNRCLQILEQGDFGVLSTVGKDDIPYGVPLNYCLIDKSIYFHSAREGHKISNFEFNPRVSFCVVGENYPLPKKFSTAYESVIVFGEVQEVFAEEKIAALYGLITKYAKEYLDRAKKYIQAYEKETRVFKITIKKISGKARK